MDARYGIGWAFQNQGRFDDAVNAYVQVAQVTKDDRAGRAHLQIGQCRAKQKKWADAGKEFQTVYFGYDLPELKFTAMIEHARVLVEEKKPDDAVKLLEKRDQGRAEGQRVGEGGAGAAREAEEVINRARNRDGEVEDSVDNGTELQKVSRHGVIRGGGKGSSRLRSEW